MNEDIILTCQDCGVEFPFSRGEQAYFAQKGLFQPKRCSLCARAKKQRQQYLEKLAELHNLRDQRLTCRCCHQVFVFTALEQVRMVERGIVPSTRICNDCRCEKQELDRNPDPYKLRYFPRKR